MQILLFATLALAALGLAWSFRRPAPASAASRPTRQLAPTTVTVPGRIANPRRANRADVKVWVLQASPACELTREFLHGRRYRTEEAVALPAMGCNLTGCTCHYEPAGDARRGERRADQTRRQAVRFESRGDRRARDDRRDGSIWQRGSLR